MEVSFKKIVATVFAIVVLITLISLSGKMAEVVDAGEVVVIQDPIDGDLHVYSQPGWVWQNFGNATHYKKSFQFWFSKQNDQGSDKDESIKIRFNDGGHAQVSGSVRINFPIDEQSVVKLHTDFRSQEAIEQQLIRTQIEKAIYMTGPLMSSKESYAEKRNDLITYIEDQAANGVYKTLSKEVKTKDELSGVDKTATVVEIAQTAGAITRQEISPLKNYHMQLNALSLNSIDYDKNVEAQIVQQQSAIMQVQTAMANAKRAEQDAITTEMQGKAKAAQAKWDQEVIKAKLVTEAEQKLEVQRLATTSAELYKKQQILEGEGESTKQRLIMQANGALDQKLEAYKEVQKYWADAFSKYQGAIVPSIVTGGSSGSNGNGMLSAMDWMGIKIAKDMSTDMKIK